MPLRGVRPSSPSESSRGRGAGGGLCQFVPLKKAQLAQSFVSYLNEI